MKKAKCIICRKKFLKLRNQITCSEKCSKERRRIWSNEIYSKTPQRIKFVKKYRTSKARKVSVKKYKQSEKGKAAAKRWVRSEANKLLQRRYRLKHPEKARERGRAWEKTPKGIIKHRRETNKRRLRKANCNENYANEELERLRKATKGKCPICKKQVGVMALNLDHIYPISKAKKGRVYTIKDIRFICRVCNSKKGAKI